MRPPLFALAVAAAVVLFASSSLANERSFDGGAHIWVGSGQGEFRVYAGPRWHWGDFSLYPYGALGAAFFTGLNGNALSLGLYGDADYRFDLGNEHAIRTGVGGGAGHIVGLYEMTGVAIPQGYAQVGYQWGVNFVGVQALVGPSYDRTSGMPSGMAPHLGFSGIGMRFEYQIEEAR